MNAAGVLTRGKEPFEVRETISVDSHSAHVEVSGGANFDTFPGQVKTDSQAAFAHPGKIRRDEVCAEVRNIDPYGVVVSATAGCNFQKTRAGDAVARRALHTLRIVALHVTFAAGVEQMSPCATQAFFQQSPIQARTGHN